MTNQSSSTNSKPLVRISGGNRLITTSLAVSHHFGKKHKNVLQAIENLDCSHQFNQLNFQPVEYTAGNGEQRPAYEITRDGFMFLCMGFTGASAAKWKEKYILAFNAMENKIHADTENVAKLLQQNQALQNELLKARPIWADIIRYKHAKLSSSEIGKLISRSSSSVTGYVRTMNRLGFGVANKPQPKQLALALGKEA